MVLDEIHRKIYMFGGWSGTEDLDDLWAFDLSSYTWSILFDSCEKYALTRCTYLCLKQLTLLFVE